MTTSVRARVMVAAVCFLGSLGVAVPVRAQTYPPDPAATCRTFDAGGARASLFSPGQEIRVDGSDFTPQLTVTVRFVQGLVDHEIAAVPADDAGTFSTGVGKKIPNDAKDGGASIRATDGERTASCAVQVAALPGSELPRSGQDTLMLALWGVALLCFGTFLVVVTWRTWRASRLEAAVVRPHRSPTAASAPLTAAPVWRPVRREPDDDVVFDDPEPEDAPEEDDEPPPLPRTRPPRPVQADEVSPAVARLLKDTKGWVRR